MKSIDFYHYIAANNPAGAKAAMEAGGYHVKVRSYEGMVADLKEFVRLEGEKGLMALAAIHPDRELILSASPQKMGADGFTENNKASNIAPVSSPQPVTLPTATDYTPLMLGGLFTITLLLVTVIIQKN
jgi:hypothetical protein